MKKSLIIIGIGFLLIGASIFSACTKEGPMGPAGPAGSNGSNGTDGKDANASCLVCHTTSNFDSKLAEYKFSKHFFGTSSARNTKYCARCHTSDGFEQITANGQFVASNDMPEASRINCETCHKHSGFDFTGDTVSMILRTTTPIALNYYNNARTEDFGKINNLCVTCHQIRGATTVAVALKSKLDPSKDSLNSSGILVSAKFAQLPFFPFDNTSKSDADMATSVDFKVGQSVAVHDGNQSNLFKGINGFEYPGKTYTRTWKHSDWACTDCHMNEVGTGMNKNYPNSDGTTGKITTVGGHTLVPNEEKCKACHTSDHLVATENAINGLLVQLANKLVAKKLFKPALDSKTGAVIPFDPATETGTPSAFPAQDFYGTLLPATADANKYGLALATANYTTSGSLNVNYVSTVTMRTDATKFGSNSVSDAPYRKGSKWTYGELGAAYNFGFIMSELSKGIHNPTYAQQILQTSIDYLNSK